MLLSHSKQFLFVHIAKTGGTSIREALSPYRWGHRYAAAQFISNKMSQFCGHKIGSRFPRHSRIIAAKEMLPEEYFNGLFKFSVVRNPWDLQVSSYHHIKRERPQVMEGHETFERFMRWKFNPERPYQYHIDTSLQLQSDYLVDLHGNLLTDFIGHYENLQEDFDAICSHLSISPSPLPHKRKATDRGSYQAYYTDDLKRLMDNHFAKDIQLLGYCF